MPSDAAKLRAVKLLVNGLESEVERTREHRAARERGGQMVSDHSDFCSAPPSVLSRLDWWIRAFRSALGE